ncbi:EAL domain-containing protein [Holophaga foetida]|uniref:EAL domain-containing protein n=1 Tax=Holophaga foetida TaxID=35839 RepID=UPI0002474308|nr:EAL domain-containing protein [Holophaga foetida]
MAVFELAWLLFLGFSILVVHVCQRLVEQAALAIEELERRANFARTSLCIGAMVWSLDALGLFLYQDMAPRGARLAPAIFSLIVMVLAARICVPALVSTRDRLRIMGAGALLATGMLFGHFLQVSALGKPTGEIRWGAVLLAILIATALAGGLALRHRSARLRSLDGVFKPLTWGDKVVGGLVILPLHICLTTSVPLSPPLPGAHPGEGLPVLLALVLFGVMIAAYRISDVAVEARRQRILNRAFAMVRSVRDLPQDVDAQRLALIAERLDSLFGDGCLEMHYQPILPVSSHVPGIRFEALLRVEDPDLGRVNPELVFLACERMGRTGWADRQVLRHALAASRAWWHPGAHCSGIAVNVAPDTLLAQDFVTWLSQELERHRLSHGWLHLEITEHAMITASEDLVGVLRELLGIGVGVVMDDFGAGFSSLGILVDLPLRGIKFDRALITNLVVDPDRQTLVRHLCAMAKDLRVNVTVEGIERQDDLGLVRKYGADCVQGYLLARPMPGKAVPDWLCTCEPQRRMAEGQYVCKQAPVSLCSMRETSLAGSVEL